MFVPFNADGLGFEFNTPFGFIELADGLLLVYSLIVLQALDLGVGCICDCVCQLSLSAAGGTFQQQWRLQSRRQVNRLSWLSNR